MAARTVEQRIEKANMSIMKHPSFCTWAGLLFLGKTSVSDRIPTACVDMAGNTYYNPKFVESLQSHGGVDSELNFVVLHETGHKALLHLVRGKKLFEDDPALANIACDHVANNMILEADPQEKFAYMPRLPDGRLRFYRDPKYIGWSFREVYNDLKKQQQAGGGSGGQGQGGGEGMDTHDLSGGPGDGTDKDGTGKGKGQVLTPDQIKQIEQQVDDALRSGSYLAGKQGGNANRLVGDMLEPKIDWKEQMREFALESFAGEDDATWRRPHRRFVGMDMYLPSYIQEAVGKLFGAIDVSGSVGDREMNACISEIMELCRLVRPSALDLIYWDDGIRKIESYTPEQYDQIHTLTRPVGGGGTVIEEVATHVNKGDYQAGIILTDGYLFGSWGEWSMPTLWAITSRNVLAPVGKSLYLEVD